MLARWRAMVAQFLVTYRPVLIAMMSAIASLFVGLWLRPPSQARWLVLFVVTELILVIIGVTPEPYGKVRLIGTILPSIHRVLGLDQKERITVHYLTSSRAEQYEQLTDYYPTMVGRGRRFSFSHGITGQCFKSPQPRCYSVPEGEDFDQAMKERWSFSADALPRLTQDRRSFYSHPIGREGAYARAVLYMDSPNPNRFSDDTCDEISTRIEGLFLPVLLQILGK